MREITGRQVFAVTASAFAVIIGVNLLLAYKAVSTFPGLEVANSYVASQTWEADRAAQAALGWTLKTEYSPEAGRIELAFTDAAGLPVEVGALSVLVGRPTEARNDVWPVFALAGDVYRAPLELAPGKWILKVEAAAPNGTKFRQRLELFVKS